MNRFILLFTFLLMTISYNNATGQQPVELGKVSWLRNMDDAQKLARQTNKPILLLFQEVPGCITCQNYGNHILSHPLIVEAIESHFVPLAIYNNVGGHDKTILSSFNEPSWNNPVVRIINADQDMIVPRLSGNYSASGLVNAMITAMSESDMAVPLYLELLSQEASTSRTAEAVYRMHCFWTGEAHLGNKNGVLKTEAGFSQGKEVVKVTYDPSTLKKEALDSHAAQKRFDVISQYNDYRPDREPQYYLLHSPLADIPMTDIQRTRVNSALGHRQDPLVYLSPRQLAMVDAAQVKY